MLEDFEYNADAKQVIDVLRRFNVTLPEYIAMVRFEVITPDSFMWRLLLGEAIYYLYAEDFIPGISHVKKIFDEYLKSSSWSFVKPRTATQFEDASPVKGASVYSEPDENEQFMEYAVDCGNDFVFLVRSTDDANNAQFSDHAPRGFGAGN